MTKATIKKKAKANKIEVEDILACANSSEIGMGELLIELTEKYSWSFINKTEEGLIVPLGKWACTVSFYLNNGFTGLANLLNDDSREYKYFVFSLLSHIRTTECIDFHLNYFKEIIDNPEMNLEDAFELAKNFNDLLSFKESPFIKEEQRIQIKNFLYKFVNLNPKDLYLALAYCALRGVGDDTTISFLQDKRELTGDWENTKSLVIKALKKRLH